MKSAIASIFKTFILSALVISPVYFAYAQTAAILPPAKTTFFDKNGKPLSSGKVYFYIPNTTTLKTTWQDAAETVPNTNPVVLDSAGRALILGSGTYRQVVKDINNNQIWDQLTSAVGGGTGGSTVGDGTKVGTVLPWAGLVAPNNYAFTYGQQLSRTTYSQLMTTLTLAQSITCSSGSAVVTAVADTSQVNIGGAVEASCLPSNSKVVSKTVNSITLNNIALASTTVTATVFPWGDGDGVSTFNVPDLRGAVMPGRNNMGGAAGALLTSSFYTDPNSIAGIGGNQSNSLGQPNLPPVNFAVSTSASPTISVSGTVSVSGTNSSIVTAGGVSANAAQLGANAPLITGPALGATVSSSGANTLTGVNTINSTGTAASGGTSVAFRTVQPSVTINYIIKLVPDISLSVARCEDLTNSGTACTANVGTSGATIGLLNAANTWSANQSFSSISGAFLVAVANGGTGQTTTLAARSVNGLNIESATSTGDANYTILPTDRMVYHTALSAARTDTLPAASSVNIGQQFVINDFRGVASASNTITILRNGADTINGLTSLVAVNSQYGAGIFWSDGVSRWTFQPIASGAGGGTVTQVSCGTGLTGGAITTTGTCAIDPTYKPNLAFGGRLTLLSGKPNIDTDVVSSQNIWYAPAENKGITTPIYNGTDQRAYQFTSGPTDQIGLNLNLAGSANWAAGTVHDVFMTLNGGVPVLATRLWDAGMSPTTAQITNVTTITTGTGPNTWTRASNAFDGTTVRPTSTSAVLVTSNNNQDVNCLGQDWGAGNSQIVSQVRITAPTDNYLFNSGPASVQFTSYGSADNANWQILDVRYVNVGAVGIGGTATLPMNQSYQTPYRYIRTCIRGDGVNNVLVAQLKYDTVVAPSAGRRLTKYNGVLTNDASIAAARINSTTTITIPTNQGTYLGTIQIDAGGNGAVSAYINAGPSRVYNIWNIENQIDIIVRASVNTLAATNVAGYVYNLPSNTSWTTIQSSTFNMNVLIGYSKNPVTVNLIRSAFFNAIAGNVSGYSAGIAVDTVVGNFSGTECSSTVDTSGQAVGIQCFADLVLPPFYGNHLLTAIETLGSTAGTMTLFTDIRNTRMQASWKG